MRGLEASGAEIRVIGHCPEQRWPKGRVFWQDDDPKWFLDWYPCERIAYCNAWGVKERWLDCAYARAARRIFTTWRPDDDMPIIVAWNHIRQCGRAGARPSQCPTDEFRFNVTNDLFARESWYFRNALVRANYENTQLNVAKTTAYLEDFFKVLLFGEEIELKNRFLRIGFEYGSKNAEKVADLHRRVGNSRMGGNVGGNMGGSLLSVLPKQQQSVCRFMLKDPSITALQIAKLQKVRVNTIEKRIAVLRKKGVIVREGGTRGVWKVLWH